MNRLHFANGNPDFVIALTFSIILDSSRLVEEDLYSIFSTIITYWL